MLFHINTWLPLQALSFFTFSVMTSKRPLFFFLGYAIATYHQCYYSVTTYHKGKFHLNKKLNLGQDIADEITHYISSIITESPIPLEKQLLLRSIWIEHSGTRTTGTSFTKPLPLISHGFISIRKKINHFAINVSRIKNETFVLIETMGSLHVKLF